MNFEIKGTYLLLKLLTSSLKTPSAGETPPEGSKVWRERQLNQASPSMGFSGQEYWIGLPFPSPGDLPDPGTEPRSPTLQGDTLPSEPPGNLPKSQRR